MKSNSNSIVNYIGSRWGWAIPCYFWAYTLFAFYLPISLFVPKLRIIFAEYRTDATSRSLIVINLTGTTMWVGSVVSLSYWMDALPPMQFLSEEGPFFLLMYILGLGIGYVALFVFADYMKKRKVNDSN